MADEATKRLISQLKSGSSVPGLSLATVVPNYVQVEFGDKINAIEDSSQRAKYKADLQDYYLNGEGKNTLQSVIDEVNYYYGIARSMISEVSVTAPLMSPMNLLPSTLVTGSATGVANPAWVTPHNSFLKGSLKAKLTFGKDALVKVCEKSLFLHYDISSVANPLYAQAVAAEQIINAIV